MSEALGRPTMYNEELADKICEAVAISTDGLSKVCARNPDFPSRETIYQWRYRHKSFADKYAQAKRTQAELLAEEIADIADDGTNDYYVDEDGNERINGEHIQRSRLRVDTRKWIACKLLPKVYGDKQPNENQLTASQLLEGIKALVQQKIKEI